MQSWSALYSPEGTIPQIENAFKAASNTDLTLAINLISKSTTIFVAAKTYHSDLLQKSNSENPNFQNENHTNKNQNEEIIILQNRFLLKVSGLEGDCLKVKSKINELIETFRKENGIEIPLNVLVQKTSEYFFNKTLFSTLRPLGVSVILAGPSPNISSEKKISESFQIKSEEEEKEIKRRFPNLSKLKINGLFDSSLQTALKEHIHKKEELKGKMESKDYDVQIYSIEPSGAFDQFKGTATGYNMQNAKAELETLIEEEIDSKTAIKKLCKIVFKNYSDVKEEVNVEVICMKIVEGKVEFWKMGSGEIVKTKEEVMKEISDEEN